MALAFVVELLAQGWDKAEIIANYPGITRDNIQACHSNASAILQAEKVYPLEMPGD